MSRREMWITVAVIGFVALVARIAVASLVHFPIPEDTAYYYGVARNLIEGRGLVSDAVWTFQEPLVAPPAPAFEVWLPLPSLIAAIPMALLGTALSSAQIMSVVAGSLIPILTWRLAWDVAVERGLTLSRARTLAIGAGLTAAIELPLLLHSALPDSTALFANVVLVACILMVRISARPPAGTWRDTWRDPRLLGLGLTLGLGALTRNETIWLAATWVLVLLWPGTEASPGLVARGARLRLVAVPAVVALLVFAPWAVRDWIVFGSPLPGQAITNAFSITGFDIFAFQDPPTLSRYLAVGPARLIEMRIEGFSHNLLSVLLLPSIPVGVIGLVALPWFGRGRTLRPLLIVSLLTFAATTLLFPVATTWGTYLHASGATQVLLIISCLFALDALIVRVGRIRGWTRPVAWLGPALTIFVAGAFSLIFLPAVGRQSTDVEARYRALATQMAAAGLPIETLGPVITDFPIWFAEAERAPALGLPDEEPSSILALARAYPGTTYLIISSTDHGRWPGVLDEGGADVACFREINLGEPQDPEERAALATTRVFELVCP